jgi:hypothetical protein
VDADLLRVDLALLEPVDAPAPLATLKAIPRSPLSWLLLVAYRSIFPGFITFSGSSAALRRRIAHDMDVALRVAQWVTMMHDGKVIVEGTPDEIRANEVVHELYLGGSVGDD